VRFLHLCVDVFVFTFSTFLACVFLCRVIPYDRAPNIERRCAPRPDMDDSALESSEYYRDPKYFRALRKRILKRFSLYASADGAGDKFQQTKQSRGIAAGCFRKVYRFVQSLLSLEMEICKLLQRAARF